MNVNNLRRLLTLHFAIIAVLTAFLVSHGSGSTFLPMFTLSICVVAFALVDVLEMFALNRVGVFMGMTLGTLYSVCSYVYFTFWQPSEGAQLQAIAGLLVFPEAVLFLQRKNLRVFEQLAMFLLLEIMVAALVNDNLLFGILLLPIVLLWVSSLFHMSRYATLIQLDPSSEVPMPNIAELLYARFVKTIMGEEKPRLIVESRLQVAIENQATSNVRRLVQSILVGVGAIVFSALFFYCLPRTTAGGYRPRLGQQVRVGLPSSMTLGQVGRALQDPTPVIRMKLTDANTKSTYHIDEAPYIRARVFDHFRHSRSDSKWFSEDHHPITRSIPELAKLNPDATRGRDRVLVEFDLLPKCQTDTFTLPPTYAPRGSHLPNGKISAYTQLLITEQDQETAEQHNLAYTLGSLAFASGKQLDITPIQPTGGPAEVSQMLSEHLADLLNFNPLAFPSVEELRTRILREAGVSEAEPLFVAKAIEQFFAQGTEFKYTLDLTAEANPELDPVEDFVANQHAGHCQYFAATMVVMLRQSGIPARLVIGYRPSEFNSFGKYFHVRQRDAHAWVEARFASRELTSMEYRKWIAPNSDYWIRFDPTPSGDAMEEIVAQPNGLGDYADKLWKGYVLEGRELSGEKSLYAPTNEATKDLYGRLAEEWQRIKEALTSGKFGTEGGSINFAWPLALLVTVLGVAILLLWQLVVNLPTLAPQLSKRLGIRPRRSDFNEEFFARCVRMLRRLGFEREESQTPQEITRKAADFLEREQGNSSSREWLKLLTESYYRIRFGPSGTLSDQDKSEVQLALKDLEKSIAQLPKQTAKR